MSLPSRPWPTPLICPLFEGAEDDELRLLGFRDRLKDVSHQPPGLVTDTTVNVEVSGSD
jgi:hypothetical protein